MLLILIVMSSILAAHSESVEEVFKSYGVVPDVIAEAPNQFLQVTYANGLIVKDGIELTPTQVQDKPKVEWEAEPDSFYTLLLTDPDAPSRKEPKFREWHHWLVGNIPGNQIEKGEELSGYVGAGPPQGTDLHRYVFLLFKQPTKLSFDEPRIPKTSADKREKFSTSSFVNKYQLGNPVAGNFFQAQYDDYVPLLYKQLTGN